MPDRDHHFYAIERTLQVAADPTAGTVTLAAVLPSAAASGGAVVTNRWA